MKEPKLRVQIVSERSTFDENPSTFRAQVSLKMLWNGFGMALKGL